MELIAALKLVEIGDEIEVWSSDKGSVSDIPQWVNKVRHEMVGVTPARRLLEHRGAQSQVK